MIYRELNIDKLAQQQVQEYSDIAQKSLAKMRGDKDAIETLSWLVDQLIGRTI